MPITALTIVWGCEIMYIFSLPSFCPPLITNSTSMAVNKDIICAHGGKNLRNRYAIGNVLFFPRRFHPIVSIRSCSANYDDVSLSEAHKISEMANAITHKHREPIVEHLLVDHRKNAPFENLGCDSPRKCSLTEKLKVAVDVDEVLGSFLSALNRFLAVRYSLQHSVEEYHVYEFCKIWNCSTAEANIRVHEFFGTPYFNMGINPISGAYDTLNRLSAICSFSVVTSRQNAIKHQTIAWLQKHFPDMFDEIHFGNHFALDGQSKSKSEICRSVGAGVLIDDNPRYAVECAKAGIRVLLFDLNNSYPWSKMDSSELHPLVIKVHSWEEVEQQLTSWVATN